MLSVHPISTIVILQNQFACLILDPICFYSSSSGHLRTFFCNVKIACDAYITPSLMARLEMTIAWPTFWRDASFPKLPKYLRNNMMYSITGHLSRLPQHLHNNWVHLQSCLPHQGKSTNMPLKYNLVLWPRVLLLSLLFWESRHFGVVKCTMCRLVNLEDFTASMILRIVLRTAFWDKLTTLNK